jgi:hypothetical protein
MYIVSPCEDHLYAQLYADNLIKKSSINASHEQIILGARGELAFARCLGPKQLQYCRDHLIRENASIDDYRFDLPGRIDVKTCESKNKNLIVHKVQSDVRYVLLRATRDIIKNESPCELQLEIMGWSRGDKKSFEPFRFNPKKSFQSHTKLLEIHSLFAELIGEMDQIQE